MHIDVSPTRRTDGALAPLLAIGLAILLWRGSRQTGTSEYIVEGKIPKLSLTGIQQMLEYAKKVSTVLVELFKT